MAERDRNRTILYIRIDDQLKHELSETVANIPHETIRSFVTRAIQKEIAGIKTTQSYRDTSS